MRLRVAQEALMKHELSILLSDFRLMNNLLSDFRLQNTINLTKTKFCCVGIKLRFGN